MTTKKTIIIFLCLPFRPYIKTVNCPFKFSGYTPKRVNKILALKSKFEGMLLLCFGIGPIYPLLVYISMRRLPTMLILNSG